MCVRFCTKLYLYAFNQPNICRHIKMVGIRLVHPTRHSTTTTTLSANTKSTQTSGCDDYEVESNIGKGGGDPLLFLLVLKKSAKSSKIFSLQCSFWLYVRVCMTVSDGFIGWCGVCGDSSSYTTRPTDTMIERNMHLFISFVFVLQFSVCCCRRRRVVVLVAFITNVVALVVKLW